MKKSASRQPLFEVRHSPVHGYGVFALRKIRKGTTITEYLGERVSHDEADSRYENKEPNDNHTFLFTVDSKTVIDGGVGGNDARFINHGCDPNCQSTTLKKRIYVEAVRTIRPGEELAYDYQIERDPDDPPDVDEIFACRCGAAKCRGSMLVARKEPRRKEVVKASKAARRGKKSASKTAKKSTKAVKKNAAKSAEKGGKKAGKKFAKRSAKESAKVARKTSRAAGKKSPGAIFDIAPAMARKATAKNGGRKKSPGAIFDIAPAMARRATAKNGGRKKSPGAIFDVAPAMARRATARDGGRKERRGAAR